MTSVFRRICALLLFARKRDVVFVALSMVLVSALDALGVGLIFPIVRIVSEPSLIERSEVLSALFARFGFTSHTGFLLALIAAFAVFFAVKSALSVTCFYWQTRFALRNSATLSTELLRRYLVSPYPLHLRRDIAEIMVNVKELVPMSFNNYLVPILILATEALTVIAVALILLSLEPEVTLATFALFAVLMLGFHAVFRARYRTYGDRMVALSNRMMTWLRDAFASVREARIAEREAFFTRGYREVIGAHADVTVAYSTLNATPRAVIESFAVVLILAALFVVVLSGRTTTDLMAVLGMFALAALRLLPSANRILFNVNQLHFAETATDKVIAEFEKMSASAASPAAASPRPKLGFKSKLVLEGVGFRYEGAASPALHDVNLTIARGERIALVGPSGAGKTTLGDLLLGLLPPTEGKASVDGSDIFSDVHAWYGQIGYVPQAIHLLNTSIRRNIAFGLEDAEIEPARVSRALELAQLTEFVAALPDGDETIVGEQGVRLSGGQRQRIGIARALYHDPEMLILDEATSALDGETEREISQSINRLSGAKTLVIIAHRLSTIADCDRLYYIRGGTVVQAGTFDQLLRTNSAFRDLVAAAQVEPLQQRAVDGVA